MSASTACPACGTVNAAVNSFCVNCGTRLGTGTPAAASTPPSGPPPTTPPAYAPYPTGYPYYAPPFPRTATFSNMLSGLFDVWTKNFLPFFVVYLALGAAIGAIGAVLSFAIFGTVYLAGGLFPTVPSSSVQALDLGLIVLYGIANFVVSVILTSVVTGAMTEYAVRRHRGESVSVEQALRRGLERFLSILGANLLLGLMLFGLVTLPLILILVALWAGVSAGAGALVLLCGGLILFVVLGVVAIFLYVSLVLYAPAIMMENANAVGGLSRSWRITRGNRWSLFGAILVTSLLAGVISVAISVPLSLTSLVGDPIVSAFASIVSSALVSALVGPWIVILVAIAYDLIVRHPAPFFGAAPPYVPGPGVAPPPGAAQAGPPPPSGPPPGP